MGVDLCIPPKKHDWVDWFEDTGLMHRYCRDCDAEEWKHISPQIGYTNGNRN